MSSLEPTHVYAFVSGTVIGRFTGIIPSIVISGILLHFTNPTIFTYDNINYCKALILDTIFIK